MRLSTKDEITTEPDPLVQQAIRNDREALDELFAQYRGPLYRRAVQVLGNPEDAEDALQDGLLSAFRNLHRFKGRSKFSTWLTRIVINAALMRRRRRRPGVLSMDTKVNEGVQELAMVVPDPRLNPEEAFARRELLQILVRGVETLGTRHALALWLRDIQGLTTREAAGVLGVPEGTVKSQLSRARLKLKKDLAAQPGQSSVPTSRLSVPINGQLSNSPLAERMARPAA